jgi:phosphoribosylformylglycinamidine synthase
MGKGLVLSCHDCSDGGLAVAVAEMCISGQVGAELDLSAIEGDDVNVKLFAESTSRWIAEVDGKDVEAFTEIMGDAAVPIGITKDDVLKVKGTRLSVPVEEMRAAWNDPIWNIMGGGAQ